MYNDFEYIEVVKASDFEETGKILQKKTILYDKNFPGENKDTIAG